MSAYANIFLISKAKFEEYRKMAHLVPHKDEPPETKFTGVHSVGPEEANSPEFKKMAEHYAKLWDFLHKNGKEPYKYKWSGDELENLVGLLKETKHIDLTENTLDDPADPDFCWYVFDEAIKQKYLDLLDPAIFKKDEMTTLYLHSLEEYDEQAIKHNSALMTKEELKSFIAMCQSSRQDITERLPDTVQAMMDGISILHKYLKLVDDKSIVILNIG